MCITILQVGSVSWHILNLLIISTSFLAEFLDLLCNGMLSTNRGNSTPSLTIYISMISLSSFVVLARALNTILKRSRGWGQLRSFLTSEVVLQVGLHLRWHLLSVSRIQFLLCWGTFPLVLLCGIFHHQGKLNFVKAFFCICWNNCVDFDQAHWCGSLHLLICVCWIIPTAQEWSQLQHGGLSFWSLSAFGFQVF